MLARSPGLPPARAPAARRARRRRLGRRSASSCAAAGTGATSSATSSPAGRGGLVVPARAARCDYPARYLFEFLDHHGMLSRHRLARLAHRGRRLAQLRGADRQAADRGRCRRAGPGHHRAPDGVTVHDRRPRHPALRRRWSSPPTRTRRCACWTAPPRRSASVLGAFRYSRNEPLCCTPTPRCCRAPRPPGRPGTTWMRGCAEHGRSRCTVSYHMNRLQGLTEPDAVPGHAQPGTGQVDRTRCSPG